MTRIAWGMLVAGLLLLGLAGRAEAQAVYVPNYWEDRPKTEIGGTLSVISVGGPGSLGVRVTRRLTPWVSLEVASDRTDGELGPAHRLLTGAARLSVPFEPRRGPHSLSDGPGSVFVTLGAGRAIGLPWRASPLVGFGVQSPYIGQVLACRVEYQRFTRGHTYSVPHQRIMVSIVVGIKDF